MKRKTIGILGYKIEGGFGVGQPNLEYIDRFGNPHIIMPWEEFNPNLDMIYLPGGLDVSPSFYGQAPGFKTSNTDVHKQFFLEHRLKLYVEANTPVFGVCLGMQQLNCFFGGRLIQDLPWHPSSPERGMPAHKVRLVDGGQEFEVNGHHHQAVLESMLAPDLRAIAFATSPKAAGFRIVEALCHKQKPIMGVQWHPEDWFDRFCDRNIRSLLSEGKPADPEKNKEKELAL